MNISASFTGEPILKCLPPKVELGVRITALALGIFGVGIGIVALITHVGTIPPNFLTPLGLPGSLSLIAGGLGSTLLSVVLTYCRRQVEESSPFQDAEFDQALFEEEDKTPEELKRELNRLIGQRKALFDERKKLVKQDLIVQKNKELFTKRQEILVKLSQLRAVYLKLENLEDVLKVEKEALKYIQYDKFARKHRALKADGPIFREKDGKLEGEIRVELENTTFTQVAGLHQIEVQNYLSGYYALYFLLCAVQEKPFTDRAHFMPMLREWMLLIFQKRILSQLAYFRGDPISIHSMNVGRLTGLEISFLIEKSKFLAPLKKSGGCFFVDLHAYAGYEEERGQLLKVGGSLPGKGHYLVSLGGVEATYPLNLIVRGTEDMHYASFHAKEPGKFTVVNSLGHAIGNPEKFPQEGFFDLIEIIQNDILSD